MGAFLRRFAAAGLAGYNRSVMQDLTNDRGSELESIIDDDTPCREAIEWAATELAVNRTFEEVSAALTTAGWDTDQAADIVEQARRQTRPLRGALTRDQVATAAERRYRQAMRAGWVAGLPTVAAAMRLLHSLGSLLMLRRFRRK